MPDYAFWGEGEAVPYSPNKTEAAFRREVSIPDLIANPGKLCLKASRSVKLDSFAGFEAGDKLELFRIPSTFQLLDFGVQVLTQETSGVPGTVVLRIGTANEINMLTGGSSEGEFLCNPFDSTDVLSADNPVATVRRCYAALTPQLPYALYYTDNQMEMEFDTGDPLTESVFAVWVLGFEAR